MKQSAPPTTIYVSMDVINTLPASIAKVAPTVSIIRYSPGLGRQPGKTRQGCFQPEKSASYSAYSLCSNLPWNPAWTRDWKNQNLTTIRAPRSSWLPESWKERSLEDIFLTAACVFLGTAKFKARLSQSYVLRLSGEGRADSCRKSVAVSPREGYETLRKKVCNIFVESNHDSVRGKKDTHKSPFNVWQKGRKKELSVFSADSLQGSCRSNYQPVTCGDWLSGLTVIQVPMLLACSRAHKLHRKWSCLLNYFQLQQLL